MFTLATRLFVIAAHPDDDAIGCGGAMSLVARSGGEVRVVYLTDGGASHPGSSKFSRHMVRDLRELEAQDALRQLGVTSAPTFFRLPDSGLHALDARQRRAACRALAKSIVDFAPDLVLAPWLRDPHSDHIAAGEIARDAVALAEYAGDFAGYEVWLSIRGEPRDAPAPDECRNVRLALDARAREAKRRSILAHRTQTTALIDDDPSGFRIDGSLLARWTTPVEALFYHQLRERRVTERASSAAC